MRIMSRTKACITIIGLGFLAAAVGAPRAVAEAYVLDKSTTNITFSWNHLGISRHSGRILDCAGTLEFEPATPETGTIQATMKVASLTTGVDTLDRQLKSPDYFDANQFPEIAFTSTAVKKTGERTGEVTGDLTIMGQARPVTLVVTWNFTGEYPLAAINPVYQDRFVSGFTATTKLLRSDWGIKRGLPLISDDIEITINTEFIRK